MHLVLPISVIKKSDKEEEPTICAEQRLFKQMDFGCEMSCVCYSAFSVVKQSFTKAENSTEPCLSKPHPSERAILI